MIARLFAAGVAFGALLAFAPGFGDPYIMPKLMPVALAVIPALLIKSERVSKLEVPGLFFMLAAMASACAGADPLYSIFGTYLASFDSLMATAILLAIAVSAARCGLTIEDAGAWICAAGLLMSGYALVQRVLLNQDPLLPEGLPGMTRVVSTQGSPIYLGACLALVGLCAIHQMLHGRGRLGAATLALVLPALWFTQTRGAMLAFLAGLVFFSRRLPLLLLPGLLFVPRLVSLQADAGRWQVWRTAWRIFREHPFLGYGPGNFFLAFRRYVTPEFVTAMGNPRSAQDHAHNDVLQIMATMGIVGLVAYAFCWYAAFQTIRFQERPERRAFVAGLLACLFVLGKFNPIPFSACAVAALLLGTLSSLISAPGRRLGLAACILVVAILAGRLCLASYHFGLAARATTAWDQATAFNRAAQLNPWEIQYTVRQIEGLIHVLPEIMPAGRPAAIEAAQMIAAEARAHHPMDSFAHELYGRVATLAIAHDPKASPKKARDAFRRAQELAPTFEMIMVRRRGLARATGDFLEARAAERDIAELHRLVVAHKYGF